MLPVLALIFLAQEPLPALAPGSARASVLSAADPELEVPGLGGPARVERFAVEIVEGGAHTFEVFAPLFEPYAVIWDEAGDVVAAVGVDEIPGKARLIGVELAPGRYVVGAASRDGELGDLQVRLWRGVPEPLSEAELADARVEAVRQRALAVERRDGPLADSLVKAQEAWGDALAAQSRWDAAVHPYERARAILEAVFGAEHPEAASAWLPVARARARAGDLQAARTIVAYAARLLEEGLGPDHPLVLDVHRVQLAAHVELEDHEEARVLATDLIERAERVLGPAADLALAGRAGLARALDGEGRGEEAAAALLPALEAPLEPARAAAVRAELVRHELVAGRPEAAVFAAEEALALLGEEGPRELAATLHEALGAALLELGRASDAVASFERALELDAAGEHPDAEPRSLEHVAVARRRAGDLDGALAAASRAADLWSERFGADHPGAVRCGARRAELLLDLGRLDQAELAALGALEVARGTLFSGHAATARALRALVRLAAARGDLDAAWARANEALAAETADLTGLVWVRSDRELRELAGILGELVEAFPSWVPPGRERDLLERLADWRGRVGPALVEPRREREADLADPQRAIAHTAAETRATLAARLAMAPHADDPLQPDRLPDLRRRLAYLAWEIGHAGGEENAREPSVLEQLAAERPADTALALVVDASAWVPAQVEEGVLIAPARREPPRVVVVVARGDDVRLVAPADLAAAVRDASRVVLSTPPGAEPMQIEIAQGVALDPLPTAPAPAAVDPELDLRLFGRSALLVP